MIIKSHISMDIKKLGLGIKIFGIVLMVLCGGALVWSLFRPPVTTGPMPNYPTEQPNMPELPPNP